MSRILPLLDAERPDDPVELNIDDLTIRVTGPSGRADYRWEIGKSGAVRTLSPRVVEKLSRKRPFSGISLDAIQLHYRFPESPLFGRVRA
jgi:hypothetical protein